MNTPEAIMAPINGVLSQAGKREFIREIILESPTSFTTLVENRVILLRLESLESCLIKFERSIHARSQWRTPAGLFATLLLALTTADFHKFLGLTGETWTGIFYALVVFVGCWLTRDLLRLAVHPKPSVDMAVKKLIESRSNVEKTSVKASSQ